MELQRATAERYIRHAFTQMLEVAGRLGDERVNQRPLGPRTNAVAALIIHCCGVAEFWLGHVGLGRTTERDRESEFDKTATVAELHAIVDATLVQTSEDLDRIMGGTGPDTNRTGRVFLLDGRRVRRLPRPPCDRGAVPTPRSHGDRSRRTQTGWETCVMTRYVDSIEQLVTEILVRDIRRSVDFYQRLGFDLLRDGGDFVELTWEEHRLFLAEPSAFRDAEHAALPVPPAFPLANVRVMVPDVDRYWDLAREIGGDVAVPIGDRYYGLRDFTIRDPDGFGIRFASILEGHRSG
jgi:catechol 2,3-dioxygenase-like lactoylglutathione lyase family enzyme